MDYNTRDPNEPLEVYWKVLSFFSAGVLPLLLRQAFALRGYERKLGNQYSTPYTGTSFMRRCSFLLK